jgi:hypothetical protein
MSIISALKTYLKTCPALETGALVLVDHIDAPISYSIVPAPGVRVVEVDILENKTCEYAFAFQAKTSTADDYERIKSAAFNETFADWLETQTEAGTLPDLGAKKTAESIEAENGFLFEQGESATGIYQIMCKLTYQQQP